MTTAAPLRDDAVYRTWALGTRAELSLTDPGQLLAAVRIFDDELDRMDRLASRFRPDAEIARLDSAAGQPTPVSDGLMEAVEVALAMASATGGAVDPTVGAAMCRLGYDRDFSAIAPGIPGTLPAPHPVPGWDRVQVDRAARTVRVPSGTRLDLGATAKALAADRIAAAVRRACGCGVLVSLGGDVAVAGAPPGGFSIGLGEVCGVPDGSGNVAVFSGGLATSGVAVRQWRLGSSSVHHLLDPATGLPVPLVWRTVTVAAASCVDANAAATAAVVKGAAAAAWLTTHRLPARLISADGVVVTVGGWPDEGSPAVRPGWPR